MYLAGYAIECLLKAQLMEKFGLDTLQELEGEIVRRSGHPLDVFTHSIEALLQLSGARDRLLQSSGDQKILRAYHTCNRWNPSWRYNPTEGNVEDCGEFMDAVDLFRQYVANNV